MWCYLVQLNALVSDEDDLVPVGPTEAQNTGVLHLPAQQQHMKDERNQNVL